MPKVSIIVPVYNVEPFLRRCIDSILAQTFTDYELILVDDGSTDSSGMICDRIAATDSRVHVIHQKNKGAAAARNTGLENAKGEFLAFCDSDDVVSPMWLCRMSQIATPDTLPMGAYCNSIENLEKEKHLPVRKGALYSKEQYFRFNQCGIAGYLWNALYHRETIIRSHIQFRERREKGDYNEDLLFALTYIQFVSHIVYTGFSDYFYQTHEDSLSRGNKQYYFDKYAEKYELWRAFIEKNTPQPELYQKDLSSQTLYHFLGALREADSFQSIRRIVLSDEMDSCIHLADTSKENQIEIQLLKKKSTWQLYFFYKLLKLKVR